MTSLNTSSLSSQSTPSPGATLQASDRVGKALIRNRLLAFTWRIILIAVCLTGVIINSQISGFLPSLVPFTIQSNLLLAIYAGYAAWTTLFGKSEPAPAFAGAVTLYISITGLVYNLLLARVPILSSGSISNIMLHFLAPIMAVLDWLLLTTHGRLRWRHALFWLSYILGYLIFCLIRGPFVTSGSRYPYFFVNVDRIGYGGVALNTLIYGGAFWLLGMLLIFLDLMLFHVRRKAQNTSPSSIEDVKSV